MSESEFMDAAAACDALGVRRQTIYAYVSRGLLRAVRDPDDPRKSLYSHADVKLLAAKHRRPRARAEVAAAAIRWGDPVLDTSVSEVRDGRLYFGEMEAVRAAQNLTFEEIAAHHWRAPFVRSEPRLPTVSAHSALTRAMIALAHAQTQAQPMSGLTRPQIASEGARLIYELAGAFLGRSVGAAPLDQTLADAWGCGPSGRALLRQALVLISDHDLNPSTFAVRVAASTGTSLPAALLAGLAALSGPRHGGVAALAAKAVAAGASDAEAHRFLAQHAQTDPYTFGFGHPHYPQGDCRALQLIQALGPDCDAVGAVNRMAAHVGQAPNIDAAFAAVAAHLDLPEDAPFVLFALGRSAGWIAHAIEQSASGQIIRPRAQFVRADAAG